MDLGFILDLPAGWIGLACGGGLIVGVTVGGVVALIVPRLSLRVHQRTDVFATCFSRAIKNRDWSEITEYFWPVYDD